MKLTCFLDIYMPDDLGTNLLAKIRDHYPTIDIIIVTAATEKRCLRQQSDMV